MFKFLSEWKLASTGANKVGLAWAVLWGMCAVNKSVLFLVQNLERLLGRAKSLLDDLTIFF